LCFRNSAAAGFHNFGGRELCRKHSARP
jgi:hypothetical protein